MTTEIDIQTLATKVARTLKEKRMRADPFHDDVSIVLNREPTYEEIRVATAYINCILELKYEIKEPR